MFPAAAKRTTLDLDEELLKEIRKEATARKLSLKETVNVLLKKALSPEPTPVAAPEPVTKPEEASVARKNYRLAWSTYRGQVQEKANLDSRDALISLMEEQE